MSEIEKEFKKAIQTYSDFENPLNTLLQTLRELQKRKNPLILYGCGAVCRLVISFCNNLNLRIAALCDTYKSGLFEDTGLEILSPERLGNEYPDADIMICSYKFADEINEKLQGLGFGEAQIHRCILSMALLVSPSDFASKYLSGYEWAYDFFKDDISKDIIVGRLRRYIIGTELSKTSNAPEYFDPAIIHLSPSEVFVDGGAYIGDTAEEFVRQSEAKNINYRHIYSFEPDSNAYEKAIHALKKYANVDVIGKGLWNCETDLKFYNDGGYASSSFVIGDCASSVPVTSIDSFFSDKPNDELPTFIKMDIEGSEKEALIGAKTVIRQKHPKLAICVYHKPEDIYELPKLIYEIDPSYQFFLRQCADGIYETVLYAI